jgi:hypothetical protein
MEDIMSKFNKIQQLFITELLREGHVVLTLPNQMHLEVGITTEGRDGDLQLTDDYCWVIASQEDRSVSIDSYNLGLRYSNERDKIICEQDVIDFDGQPMRILEVV